MGEIFLRHHDTKCLIHSLFNIKSLCLLASYPIYYSLFLDPHDGLLKNPTPSKVQISGVPPLFSESRLKSVNIGGCIRCCASEDGSHRWAAAVSVRWRSWCRAWAGPRPVRERNPWSNLQSDASPCSARVRARSSSPPWCAAERLAADRHRCCCAHTHTRTWDTCSKTFHI